LVERLILALTNPNDLVVDPYIGVASAARAAVLHNRRAAGAEIIPEYASIARARVKRAIEGCIQRRPLGRPIYQPGPKDKVAQLPLNRLPSEHNHLAVASLV
jgi:adenine-specific DNA-methyltransferase